MPQSALKPSPLSISQIRERIQNRTPSSGLDDPAWLLPGASREPAPVQKRAAVAAVLRERARGPEVLLIRRAEHPLDPWSGHMAFPGGREDPGDVDLQATAIRETLEELALDLRQTASLIGRLDDLPAVARGRRTGLVIAPYVFELERDVPLRPNGEVAEALWAPLEPIMRGEHATKIPYELEGKRIELPAHDVEGRIVWGLTYRMLDSLFSLLR